MFSFFRKKREKQNQLEARVTALEEQNVELRQTLLKASIDLSNIDTILRATVFSQTQLADDVHQIYVAVKQVLTPDDYYSKNFLKFGPDDDDDGGLLN